MSVVTWETYDDYSRAGTSITVRWLRVGSERWHIEVGKRGIAVQLGPLMLSAGWELAEHAS